MNRDLYYELGEFIHARSWGADIKDPYWYHQTSDALVGVEELHYHNIEALYFLIKDVLGYLKKDGYLLDVWYKKNCSAHDFDQESLHQKRNYLFYILTGILEDQGVDDWEKILYNCSS